MKDSLPSCPAAPVHGHTILLGSWGWSCSGLVYRALPDWMGSGSAPLGLIRAHFLLAVTGTLGVALFGERPVVGATRPAVLSRATLRRQ
jgi:hypothetical protein